MLKGTLGPKCSSLRHVSNDLIDNEHSNMPTSDLKSVDAEITNIERPVTPVPELGKNMEIRSNDDIALLVNKCKDHADELCYTWSEVKLYHLTKSELEKYLGKVNQNESTDKCSKGDNSVNTLQLNVSNTVLIQLTQEVVDPCAEQPTNQHMLNRTMVKAT